MPDTPRSLVRRYGIAVAAVAVALLLKALLASIFSVDIPFLLFFGTVAVSAWYGGLGPGLLATALAALSIDYFLLPPFNQFGLDTPSQALRLGIFVLEGTLISVFSTARLRAEQQARQQEAWLRVTLASIGDAVIVTDADGKVTFTNPVAQRLIGWGQAEAQSQPLEAIFKIINEETRRPVENPVAKVLREGAVVGLANHTVLIARDGSELPIDDSAAPIRDKDGIIGVVMVFRDIAERKRAEQAQARLAGEIAEQRERLNNILANVPGVVWEAWGMPDAASQRLDFVSDYVENMLGYSVQEWLSTPNFWLTIVHPDDKERAAREAAAIFAGGAGGSSEFRWVRRDGRAIWVEAQSAVIRDAAGQPIGMRGVTMDISERKQAEERLRFLASASELLSSSLDYETTLASMARLAVPDLADWCAVDIQERDQSIRRVVTAHVDPAKVELARQLQQRYPSDPNATRGVPQVIRTGQPELIPEIADELLVAAAAGDAELLAILREVGLKSSIAVPLRARGRSLGALTLVSAVSGRHYTQADLALAEDLARRAAAAVDNARLYADAEAAQRRLAFLAEASEILSSSLEYESRLKSLAELVVPYLADWCIIDMVQEDGTVERLKIVLADPSKEELARQLQLRHPVLNPDGQHTILNVLRTGRSWIDPEVSDARLAGEGRDPEHVEILRALGFKSEMVVPLVARDRVLGTITYVYGASGRSYGPADLALAEDLGRRAAVAVDNARLYHETQEAVRARDQFLSIASHELKTPLTSLMGYTELLQRRAARDSSFGERDQRAVRVVSEQANRLNKLVSALLDLSRIENGQLSIDRGLVDLTKLARRIAGELQTTLHDHTIGISALEESLNIYGDELRLEQVIQNLLQNAIKYSPKGGAVAVRLERRDGMACVEVSDEGIGIPQAALSQLFRRFFRAPNAEAQHISGMGIGLYVVKEIVALHGGTIEVTSEEDVGSTFTVCLPLAGERAPAGSTENRERAPAGSTENQRA